jgi:RNA polymerase sigma-70 factor (ECF subfamily)
MKLVGLAERLVDRERFDQLVRESLPKVQRLAIRLCGDLSRAQDVSQEALLRAARGWRGFREEASFATWMYRLTVNAWRDEMRRREQPGGLEGEPTDEKGSGPAAGAAAKELGEIVAARVSELPPRQREVLILVAYEGHSMAEAAEVLEISEQNVRTTLHLAREKLKEKLAGYLEVERGEKASAARKTI